MEGVPRPPQPSPEVQTVILEPERAHPATEPGWDMSPEGHHQPQLVLEGVVGVEEGFPMGPRRPSGTSDPSCSWTSS